MKFYRSDKVIAAGALLVPVAAVLLAPITAHSRPPALPHAASLAGVGTNTLADVEDRAELVRNLHSSRSAERLAYNAKLRTVQKSHVAPRATAHFVPVSSPIMSGLPHIAEYVADCESGDNNNGVPVLHSYQVHLAPNAYSASGKYQFIDSTWYSVTGLSGHASDYSEATQDAAFIKLWANGAGASHWQPSRYCWGRYL